MKLKREILEVQTDKEAHELADILLKINPVNNSDSDAVLEKAEEQLLVSLILAASSQGDNCVQFMLDRLNQPDPKDWSPSFQGSAKSHLEEVLNLLSDRLRKTLGEQLLSRLGMYVRTQALR